MNQRPFYIYFIIAKRFGGGGHRNAAGFKVPYPFLSYVPSSFFIREGL